MELPPNPTPSSNPTKKRGKNRKDFDKVLILESSRGLSPVEISQKHNIPMNELRYHWEKYEKILPEWKKANVGKTRYAPKGFLKEHLEVKYPGLLAQLADPTNSLSSIARYHQVSRTRIQHIACQIGAPQRAYTGRTLSPSSPLTPNKKEPTCQKP